VTRLPVSVATVTFAVAVVVMTSTACGAGAGQAGDRPRGTPERTAAAGTAAAKLAPPLVASLPRLPADQPVRLIATLVPGTATEPLRVQIERLNGQLLQRFTLIEAVVLVVPGRNVLLLAELPEVSGLELADSGEPPPYYDH
jgi:hypothetical protein